ncbi:MAG: SUMF1/EgtB/PvdO family nonheme iron enzyme [Chthonomonadales bacterium]
MDMIEGAFGMWNYRYFVVGLFAAIALTTQPICGLAQSFASAKPGNRTVQAKRPKNPKLGTVWVNPKDGVEMVFIPAGEFEMGSADFEDTRPVHKVTLDSYYIGRNSVTVSQYLKFCDASGHSKPMPPDFNQNWSKPDHPIVNVSFADGLAYCKWAGGRLPTEAEWEKAASWDDVAKKKRKYPWGDEFDPSRLWKSQKKGLDAGGTKPVGSYPAGASPYGLLDMAGNVFNWCSDWYDGGFYGNALASNRNPENQTLGEKKERTVRGGSWVIPFPDVFRTVFRGNILPETAIFGGGFRCVIGK